jgi:hypothetical protein
MRYAEMLNEGGRRLGGNGWVLPMVRGPLPTPLVGGFWQLACQASPWNETNAKNLGVWRQ